MRVGRGFMGGTCDAAEAGHGRAASSDAPALALVALAMACGAALRIAMARGDLWLDEVWSLDLVRPLSSALQVFIDVPHDNNHVVNSLWMFWLGQDRPAWCYRVPAVVLGTVSVGLAAAVCWRRSRAAAVAAATLAATALPFVTYGSEARGYAGLIAAILLAILAFDVALETPPGSRRHQVARLILGAAIGAGTLFHLTMLATAAVLGAAAAVVHFAARRPPAQALDTVLTLFRPALLGLVPAMLAFAVGMARHGGFVTGGASPATAARFLQGYGDLVRLVVGLPPWMPPGTSVACAGLLLLLAWRIPGTPLARKAAMAMAIVLLPAAMLLLRLPNLEFPRYYMVAGVMLLLAMADAIGAMWDRGAGFGRLGAGALVCLAVAAHGLWDAAAIDLGRGRYGAALAGIADPDGHARYGARSQFWIHTVATRAARRSGLVADLVPDADFCTRPPDWFIDVPPNAEAPEAAITAGPAACPARFTLRTAVKVNPLSGMPWAIYHRDGPSAASTSPLPLTTPPKVTIGPPS